MSDDFSDHRSLVAIYNPEPIIRIHQRKYRTLAVGQTANVKGRDALIMLLKFWMLKCHVSAFRF